MAVTVERLIATLEARIDKYEKNLQKAYGQTDRQFSRIERRGKMMEGRLAKLGAGGLLKNFGAGFAGGIASAFSAKAAQDLIDSSTRIQNALKVAGLSGKELKDVYDSLYESAQRNGAPLEALATLYGRAAQQQNELGVSTSQLKQFTDDVAVALRVAGTDATAASGALTQLGQALGSGTVHAEEFGSILEGVPTIAQAVAAGIKEANGSVAALKQLVVDGKVSSRAFFDGFAAGSDMLAQKAANATFTTSQGFTILTNSLTRAAGRFDTSTEASQRFGDALHTLSLYVDQLNFDGMLHGLDAVADKMNSMMVTIENWGAAFGKATGSENFGRWLAGTGFGKALGVQSTAALRDRMSGDVPQADALIQAWAQKTYGSNVTTKKTDRLPAAPSTTPISLADYPTTGAKKKGRRGSYRATADDRFAEDLQSIKDRTAALKEEQATLGMSFFEQQKRAVSLDLEQEALRQVREEARRKGDQDWQNAQLSPNQVKAIDEVSDAYARQADELRKAQEAQDLQRDVLKGVFSDFRSALDDGKLDWQDFANIAMNALDKIIDKIENDLIDAILQANSASGSGGGIFGALGKLFGLGGGGFSSWDYAMADLGVGLFDKGGYTGPGGKYQPAGVVHAGEYVFDQDSVRAAGGPAALDALRKGLKGYAGGGLVDSGSIPRLVAPRSPSAVPNITYAPVIDARGADAGAVARLEKVLQQDRASFKGRVVEAVADARRRNMNV